MHQSIFVKVEAICSSITYWSVLYGCLYRSYVNLEAWFFCHGIDDFHARYRGIFLFLTRYCGIWGSPTPPSLCAHHECLREKTWNRCQEVHKYLVEPRSLFAVGSTMLQCSWNGVIHILEKLLKGESTSNATSHRNLQVKVAMVDGTEKYKRLACKIG